MTDIEWVKNADGSRGETWNPVRGCRLTSPGCQKCYAMRQAHRFSGPGKPYDGLTRLGAKGPVWTGEFREVPDALDIPLRRRKPTTWFVNSMSDLFGEGVSNEFIAAVFGVMAATQRHTYQILTKRGERLPRWFDWVVAGGRTMNAIGAPRETIFVKCEADKALGRNCADLGLDVSLGDMPPLCFQAHPWPLPNVWLGVSVEDRKHGLPRIEHLRRTPAAVRFLSVEPLLEDLGALDLTGIDWVIVGGESGNGARPMHPDWALSIRDQCVAAKVPFFFKQWGEYAVHDEGQVPPGVRFVGRYGSGLDGNGVPMVRVGKKAAGRRLGGRTWDEMPMVTYAK